MDTKAYLLEGTISYSQGGTAEEIVEFESVAREAGYVPCGSPVEGLAQSEITVPGFTFEGVEGLREYIAWLEGGKGEIPISALNRKFYRGG